MKNVHEYWQNITISSADQYQMVSTPACNTPKYQRFTNKHPLVRLPPTHPNSPFPSRVGTSEKNISHLEGGWQDQHFRQTSPGQHCISKPNSISQGRTFRLTTREIPAIVLKISLYFLRLPPMRLPPPARLSRRKLTARAKKTRERRRRRPRLS